MASARAAHRVFREGPRCSRAAGRVDGRFARRCGVRVGPERRRGAVRALHVRRVECGAVRRAPGEPPRAPREGPHDRAGRQALRGRRVPGARASARRAALGRRVAALRDDESLTTEADAHKSVRMRARRRALRRRAGRDALWDASTRRQRSEQVAAFKRATLGCGDRRTRRFGSGSPASGSFKRLSYSQSAVVQADADLRAQKTALAGLRQDTCVVEVELRVLDAELQLSARDLRSGRCVCGSLEDRKNEENGDAEPVSTVQSLDSIAVSAKF